MPAPGRLLFLLFLSPLIALATGCGDGPWNSPHAPAEDDLVTYYSAMSPAPPKHLDPVISYATDESLFIAQVYEPPMGYHFLKRPYELEPMGVAEMPEVTYLDADGQPMDPDAGGEVAFTRYLLRVRDDARFQPHPAFAKDASGEPLYLFDSADEGRQYSQLSDFAETDSREVLAEDYLYQIKRLADPFNASPMLGFMAQYIVGMKELTAELDGLEREGWVDLRPFSMRGIEALDEKTFTITIYGRYPQFIYWLAMHFFAPIPWEADRFYHNPGFLDRNLTLDWWPVGSGPFMIVRNDPNSEIVLEANPNFRADFYPAEGEPGDAQAGSKKKSCPCGPSSCRATTSAPAKSTATPTACLTRPSRSGRMEWNCRMN
jgi:oligopeptide transport system substrate-binding protein